MTTFYNLLAVIDNINGINFVTRNQMRNALLRKNLDRLHVLINHSDESLIVSETQATLSMMLKNTKPQA